MIARFRLGGRHVADGLEQATGVEPSEPLERGRSLRLRRTAWAPPLDHLGLDQAVDGLREGVVVAVADAADRGLDAGLCQAFDVAD